MAVTAKKTVAPPSIPYGMVAIKPGADGTPRYLDTRTGVIVNQKGQTVATQDPKWDKPTPIRKFNKYGEAVIIDRTTGAMTDKDGKPIPRGTRTQGLKDFVPEKKTEGGEVIGYKDAWGNIHHGLPTGYAQGYGEPVIKPPSYTKLYLDRIKADRLERQRARAKWLTDREKKADSARKLNVWQNNQQKATQARQDWLANQAVRKKQAAAADVHRGQVRVNAAARKKQIELQAIQRANKYFTSHGVDPRRHKADIQQMVSDIMARTYKKPEDMATIDPFTSVGSDVFSGAQDTARSLAAATANKRFAPDYLDRILPGTLDDKAIEKILNEQQSEATNYINNLLKRGVITRQGFGAATKDIQGQRHRATEQMGDLSADLMATGRQSLQDIINKGMQAAGTVGLAQKYNPSLYNKQANTTAAAFRTGFEGKLRGRLPGSLFDTSNLANIAGAAQGPQNTAFDPISLAGRPAAPKAPRAKIREDEDDEEFVF